MAKEQYQIPCSFSNVDIPESLEDRIKLISGLRDEIVLLEDEHHGLPKLGKIRYDPSDNQAYGFEVLGTLNRAHLERRHYHDITALYRSGGSWFFADFEKAE